MNRKKNAGLAMYFDWLKTVPEKTVAKDRARLAFEAWRMSQILRTSTLEAVPAILLGNDRKLFLVLQKCWTPPSGNGRLDKTHALEDLAWIERLAGTWDGELALHRTRSPNTTA
jgi:hypothetical protein